MKNLLIQLFVISLLVSCSTAKKDEFKISGKIDGMSEGKLVLEQHGDDGYFQVDTTYLENGEFSFILKSKLPEVYYLWADKHESPVIFFAGDSDVNIHASIDSLEKAVITGSVAQDQYENYKKESASFNHKMSVLYEQYKEAKGDDDLVLADSLDKLMDDLHDDKSEFLTSYLMENNKSYAGPYIATRNLYRFDLDELKKIVDNIDSSLVQYIYVKKLNNRVELLKTVDIGQPAIDFVMEDTLGNPVRLLSYKGKYILVDFWASWCSPCRKENPNVVAVYNEFKDKGFDVLGVSFDKDKEAWLNAIHNDKLAWSQVSELTGWKSSAGKLYGIRSIPANVLIDPDGIIIARNLREGDLREKIGSLLGMQ